LKRYSYFNLKEFFSAAVIFLTTFAAGEALADPFLTVNEKGAVSVTGEIDREKFGSDNFVYINFIAEEQNCVADECSVAGTTVAILEVTFLSY